MRSLLLATAAGLLLLSAEPGDGTKLATDYGRERTLRTTSEMELDIESEMEITIDGEPMDHGGRGGGMSMSLVRRSVVLDQVLEGGKDGPKRVRRTFETLGDENSMSFGMEDMSDNREYPLEGVTLELSVDDDGEVEAELVEGPEPDDGGLLEGHVATLALDAFLPDGEVEVGASWTLDDETLRRALAGALDTRLFPAPAREESGGGERGRGGPRRLGGTERLFGVLEWEGTARLEAVDEEHEGIACARIVLEVDASGDVPERDFGGRGRGRERLFETSSRALEGTVEVSLEGELLFALEDARPLFLELDGLLLSENSFERERDGRIFSSRSTQTGQLTLTVMVEEN